MATQQYVVQVDERWDLIANKAYGNPGKSAVIIEANPNVSITDIVPAGTILEIPILEEELVKTPTESLPPWKQ
ncbi:hypothetical protein D3C87_1994460 [compost metagenome]